MKLTFPFQYIATNKFGKIFRPQAGILVLNKDFGFYVHKLLIVDSGADFTIFPRKDAYYFGIDLDKETTKGKINGVGGEETVFLYDNLEIKLGNARLKIPVGFINRNDVPALLGRQQFMELFKITFDDFKVEFYKLGN